MVYEGKQEFTLRQNPQILYGYKIYYEKMENLHLIQVCINLSPV